jgi:transcription-repair coupling factor (superfamily II helicase)
VAEPAESISTVDILTEAAGTAPFQRLLAAPGLVRVAEVAAPGHAFVAAVLARVLEAPVLLLAADPRSAEALAQAASAFLPAEQVVRFPAWESLPYEGISPSPQIAGARAEAAHRMRATTGPLVIVAPVSAAIQGLDPDLGVHEPLVIAVNGSTAPDGLATSFAELGYARVDVVEHRGEFAVRGGIVDVFPSTTRRPVRAEFLGDEIESLRHF